MLIKNSNCTIWGSHEDGHKSNESISPECYSIKTKFPHMWCLKFKFINRLSR